MCGSQKLTDTLWLREQQLMDYDDQMVYAYNMLRKIPELLAYFQEKYPVFLQVRFIENRGNTIR